MKILNADQIRQSDLYTIKNEPISSLHLMDRASDMCFEWITQRFDKSFSFVVFAGVGNNGGDGLVIARKLHEVGYQVKSIVVHYSDKVSLEFDHNYHCLKYLNADIYDLNADNISGYDFISNIDEKTIKIDALLGIGFTRKIEGFLSKVIEIINSLPGKCIAIDMPSGLPCELGEEIKWSVIKANFTLTFQIPKLTMLFASNYVYVGEFVVLDIGLNRAFISHNLNSKYYFITNEDIPGLIKPRGKYSNKSIFGHALIMSGSKGKIGASILSAKASLRAGVGLVTSFIPNCGYIPFQVAVPEAMCVTDQNDSVISEVKDLSAYDAIAVGPGIGKDKQTANALKLLIQNSNKPLIIDADAINILSENKTWLSFLPKNCIFTPHYREFERLVGKVTSDKQMMDLANEFCWKYSCYLILKGAHSIVFTPQGELYFNSTGNPGMATAGSGDVLTGILVAFLSQGYDSLKTAILGVYIHGLAGDMAADDMGYESLKSGDIIDYLPKAFNKLLIG